MIRNSWRKRAYKAQSNEKGFILITVLLVIALLFPLVLTFSSRVQLNLTQAENFRDSVQALRLARAGVQGAIGILKQDDPSYDSRRDNWATSFPSLSLTEGGMLTVSIVDEDGKLPINNIVVTATQTQAQKTGTAPAAPTPAQSAAGDGNGNDSRTDNDGLHNQPGPRDAVEEPDLKSRWEAGDYRRPDRLDRRR